MRKLSKSVLAFCLSFLAVPSYAAWGDNSYNQNPAMFDEDKNAQWDVIGFLTNTVINLSSRERATQNFETGFTVGQQLNTWIAFGSTRVRFGFGDTLGAVQWNSAIGGVDPNSTQFGLTHPHGTYGNAPGVTDSARNYVADLHFLTQATTTPTPAYFVMQFERPISFIGFNIIDYAAGSGGGAALTLWNGNSLGNLTQLGGERNLTLPVGQPDGDIQFFLGEGPTSYGYPNYTTFNFAILHLDTPDSTIGFDNFTAAMTPVPEPATYSLLAMGLLSLGVCRRRSIKKQGKEFLA